MSEDIEAAATVTEPADTGSGKETTPALSLLDELKENERKIDLRRTASCEYSATNVLFCVLIAFICTANTIKEAYDFMVIREPWYRSHLGDDYHRPSRGTVYYIMGHLDTQELQMVLIRWASTLHKGLEGTIALDGKYIKGSRDGSAKAKHILSAFSATARTVLGQYSCEDEESKQSSEINAIPKLLKLLDIRGTIITVDAIGTQTKIAHAIRDGGAHYLFVVKGNQNDTRESVNLALNDFMNSPECTVENFYGVPEQKAHNRYDSRVAVICNNPRFLPEKIRKNWADIAGFGAICATTRKSLTEEPTETTTYFIYSVPDMTPEMLLQLRSDHWTIECNLHYTLDVHYREDACRARKRSEPEVLGIIRKFAFNLLNTTKALEEVTGQATKRLWCCLDRDCLEAVVEKMKETPSR